MKSKLNLLELEKQFEGYENSPPKVEDCFILIREVRFLKSHMETISLGVVNPEEYALSVLKNSRIKDE